MSENKTNHEVCTECNHPHGPENDCCCTKPPKPQPNECMKCCDPLEFKCPDIRRATCIPILGERIYDFKCINKKQERVASALTFSVVSQGPCPYTNGDKVCIEKISVKYDCLGFTNTDPALADNVLPIIIDSNATTLTATPLSCSTTLNLYSSYTGQLTPNFICCEEGRNVNLAQGPIQVGVVNFQYVLQGKIGCIPFAATYPAAPLTGEVASFGDITLYNNICLPQVTDPIDVKADFQLEILPKCVIPTSTYTSTSNTFTTNVFDCLSIKEKFYVTIKDELVVYTAFNGLECKDDCHHYSHEFYEDWCKK